jgi:hypothetical protein
MAITANVSLTEHEEQTLQVIAQQTGVTQAELLQKAVQLLIADFEHPYPQIVRWQRLQLDEAAKQQARQRFERHFGTLSADYAGSAENEQIDADLAQAYAA